MRSNTTIQFKKKCRIGQYQYDPDQIVGLGYYGKVYKGTKTKNQSQVAIKVVDLNIHPDKDATRFAKNELKIHQILKHERVIDCYHIYKKNNIYYFVTEYLQEGDLQKLINTQGPLPQYQALKLLHQIVEGLVYLKKKKVIHRDIKPANIFLKQGNIKIADFGLSVIAQRGAFMEEQRIGTPRYMSPETLRQGIYSYKCDVWSLGSLFIEMVIGEAPLSKCASFEEIVEKISWWEMVPATPKISDKARQMLNSMFIICDQKRISIDELYEHEIFHSIWSKSQSLSTTEESQIQIQDVTLLSSVSQPYLLSRTTSLVNTSVDNSKMFIKTTSKVMKMLESFVRNISQKNGVLPTLVSIFERAKYECKIGLTDMRHLLGIISQKIQELRKQTDSNLQMQAINLLYFKSTLQALQNQQLSF